MFTEADFEKMVCNTLQSNGWKYIPADQIPRNYSDVIVEPKNITIEHIETDNKYSKARLLTLVIIR